MNRRSIPRFCAILAAALPLASGMLRAEAPRELLDDPHFARGFHVLSPTPGKRVVESLLAPPGSHGEPAWDLAQWSSRHTLSGAKPAALPSGATRFANLAKSITLGPSGTPEADLALGVDSGQEYDAPRKQRQPWPHLLVGQHFAKPPSLNELASLRLRIELRLLHHERLPNPEYNPHVHTAHFLTFVTIQNLNRQSKGYGDYLWLGGALYDERERMPKAAILHDDATRKLIYTPASSTFLSASAHDAAWITADIEFLPHARAALEEAWKRGYLADSRDIADYRPASINLGWEVPGLNRAEIQVRNFSLAATAGNPGR